MGCPSNRILGFVSKRMWTDFETCTHYLWSAKILLSLVPSPGPIVSWILTSSC